MTIAHQISLNCNPPMKGNPNEISSENSLMRICLTFQFCLLSLTNFLFFSIIRGIFCKKIEGVKILRNFLV